MKKLLLFSMVLGAQGIFAHTWHVFNHTPDKLSIKASVMAGKDKNTEVNANSNVDVNVGGYCLKGMEARGTAGVTVTNKTSCEGKEFHVYKQSGKYTSEIR